MQSYWVPSNMSDRKAVVWKDQLLQDCSLQMLTEQWLTWLLGFLQAHGDSQTGVQLSVDLHLLQ